ncbi:hypothetical protein [Microbacterium sp. Kw_RZR3]|uniref:hypothetical protein n=1 Tax=unclassified Microbacterium TaxID=2609290 RepID=UPI0023DB9BF5|nr:hypothetical protein [Microbacterium sp. Kw_RZR3]MDF2046026.1 hypothetical protein [Microbacterium sp. Kw_RZR3]
MHARKITTAIAKRLRIAGWRATAAIRRRPVVGDAPAVVSLTSYGHRIATVFAAIESIGEGSVRPRRLILWLAHDDLDAGIPRVLRDLQRRGLEVHGCDDFGAHKKYYPYATRWRDAEVPLVTADDDVLYPHRWLETLLDRHREYPRSTIGYRGEVMRFLDDGSVAPYRTWGLSTTSRPDIRLVLNGVGGVLYPFAVLEEACRYGTRFLDECPRGDDLWLHRATVRSGFSPRQVFDTPVHHPAVPGSQRTALMATNVLDGNDEQVRRTYSEVDLERLRVSTTS